MDGEEEAPKKYKGGYRQINKSLNICAFEDYLEAQVSRLPDLPDVEQISPRVLRILGQNPGKFTLQGTNTYLIGTGRSRLLIDTGQGLPEWTALLSHTLTTLNITLSHVLLTHWHGDHTGGVPDLLRLYPHLASTSPGGGGGIYKHTPNRDQHPIAHGQVFAVEGATVRALHSPGHAPDHMCFVVEEDGAMCTGDNVLGHGTAAVEHLGEWMRSLRAMQADAGSAVGYPAHGAVIPDLRGKIEGELAAKRKREERVVKTLRGVRDNHGINSHQAGAKGRGSVTVRQLVAAVYGAGMDDQVRTMAVEPFIEEVLRKLAEDGKVAFEVKGGEKKWFLIQE
ncbi:beta-lactamase-like protein [Dichotomopilus funicola]|uniref:Beta-lactamase-like protein n=1 Tax=Dichotomopilus funicola TaxID=1934379 RepID=A0AAN6UY03_9PEZI|nr:beta-lactamase-like protein [Dichotomopilus funicola]